MSYGIYLPQRWRRQPPYVTGVDWSNPLARGLLFAAPDAQTDAVRQSTIALAGTATREPTIYGRSLRGNGNAGGSVPVNLSVTGQITLSAWLKIDSNTDVYRLLCEYTPDTNTNTGGFFIAPTHTGVGNGQIVVNGGATRHNTTFPKISANWTYMTVRINIAASPNPVVQVAYNNVWQTVTVSTPGTSRASFADSTMFWLSRNNASLHLTGNVLALSIHGRLLADNEVGEMYRNPWQLFRPANSPVFYSLPSGGTTITTVVGDATAAGQQAGISIDVTVAANTGNATADGLQASISVSTVIAAGVGNAVADGAQASIAANTTIAAGTGNAVADGLQADVISSGDVQTNVGNAVAAGLQATILSAETIVANVGNAVADGLQATITQADELPLIVGGFWEEQWRRIRERERKRQEPPQALIERVEEQIAEVAQVLKVPRPATVNVERVLVDLQLRAQQLELAADRVRVVQRLIAEAQALQAEIEEEEDLLMLL